MNKVFTEEVIDYIENNMCINSQDYISKITEYDLSIQKVFTNLGTFLFKTSINNNYDLNNDPFSINAYSLFETNTSFSGDALNTADILIKAFTRYKKNGLLDLYRLSESDVWDPLPKITKSLYDLMPNCDQEIFNSLNNIITIYRGTSCQEYQSNLYSQSWTLSQEKAEYFAYTLGKKYIGKKRAVIEAKIKKSDIYAYISMEKECIINPSKILKDSVVLYSTRRLR